MPQEETVPVEEQGLQLLAHGLGVRRRRINPYINIKIPKMIVILSNRNIIYEAISSSEDRAG